MSFFCTAFGKPAKSNCSSLPPCLRITISPLKSKIPASEIVRPSERRNASNVSPMRELRVALNQVASCGLKCFTTASRSFLYSSISCAPAKTSPSFLWRDSNSEINCLRSLCSVQRRLSSVRSSFNLFEAFRFSAIAISYSSLLHPTKNTPTKTENKKRITGLGNATAMLFKDTISNYIIPTNIMSVFRNGTEIHDIHGPTY